MINMEIEYGKGKTEYGPGIEINLSGDEVAVAIDSYLVAHGVRVHGPRTIRVNDELCEDGHVYIDPSGFVIANGKKYCGREHNQEPEKDCDESYSELIHDGR